jgi:hypothetical protein
MIELTLLSYLRPDFPPLSFRLRKLWAERGDFSRFKVSSLSTSSEREGDAQDKDASGWDLGANLGSMINGEDGEGITDESQEARLKKETVVRANVVMSIQDMLELRRSMMEKLGTAQNALYFSHALVSLLINSSKADQASTSNPSAAARAGSPTSNSAGGAAAAKVDTAASVSAMQRNTNASHVMGSASSLEAELGIEANVFGASRLEADRKEVEPRGGDVGIEQDRDSDDEDEVENLETELKRQRREDRKMSDMEREEKARELVDCYQSKRQGISRAAEILRGGASALRGSDERNAQEKMRWQVLSEAKRTGWSLTPDKPVRGTASNKRELLEDGNRRKDEPARDAWIGYAIPEANSIYQRKALAYFGHDVVPSSDSPGQILAFASRPRKHLRVKFIVDNEMWLSDRREEHSKDGKDSINSQLRQAQSELADAEVFDAVINECRAMATSALFATTIDHEDSISISMNGVEMCLEMVMNEEGQDSPASKDKDKGKSHPSALATAALALLRLGLMRHYRNRDDVKGPRAPSIRSSKEGQELHIPLLLPLLGPLHYATFIIRLQSTLEKIKKKDSRKDYNLRGLEKVQDIQYWLAILLQGSHDRSSAEAMELLGGSATIYIDKDPVAFLGISYPSSISLSLPMKRNSLGGRGVDISRFDLRALEGLFDEDLQ